ncbi:hypothetical protein PCANC_22725 [Puccinia coronata f. sp. avenae]|uniref:Trimethylguanosine synthase n=1 Tax=Puccinia coronata f. sp. avenae TaxID=200324 RepID=A0A2N5U9X0_9BASI|nr:hypothetical protein PCANC_22725 [Puccinia coronata f. sp. avenae]
MDKESWYSVTPEAIAKNNCCSCSVGLLLPTHTHPHTPSVMADCFLHVWYVNVSLPLPPIYNRALIIFTAVIAINKDPNKIKLAWSNAAVYGVAHKIEFICADFLGWMTQLSLTQIASIDFNRAIPKVLKQLTPLRVQTFIIGQDQTPCTAGINRSNTAARAVLEQPCSTGGRTDTVRPKREPTGRTDLSDRSRLVLGNRSQELIGQACPTRRQVLRSDSACPTTGRTRLFEHRSNCRVRPVNAGSAGTNGFLTVFLLF